MKIGIDGSRAFLKQRTGIEEYSYQVIKQLKDRLKEHRVILYIRNYQEVDFSLPPNWRVKKIRFPRLWTQIGLSLELFLHPIDVLFVPAHTVPFFHPRKTVTTVHGLEYEIMPEAYSAFERFYMRFSIKNSCRWSRKIISVSKNTKRDLMNLYDVPEGKINLVYEGYEDTTREFNLENGNDPSSASSDAEALADKKVMAGNPSFAEATAGNPSFAEATAGNPSFAKATAGKEKEFTDMKPYLLFIGRLEKRKNIERIVEAFDLFKEKTGAPHRLVLGGRFGYGEEEIKARIEKSEYKKDIVLFGFVKDARKWQLYRNAQVFLFPTLYEGFGLPVLEAQSQGVPVITSNTSSLPEVANGSAFLVDPMEPKFIADAMIALTGDKKMAKEMVKKGYENIKRFSWKNCADLIATVLTE